MPGRAKPKIEMPDLVSKFKEKNGNRNPRDAAELVNFSKKLRGFQPISFGEARKFLSQQSSTPRKRRPRPKQPETKEPEEKQPDENATETDEVPDTSPYQVGDEVLLTKERTGAIRFIGPVDFTEGTMFGIELHSQFVGSCDGSKEGKQYFECGPQRGIFVPEKKIRRKMTKSDHARKDSWLAANAERNSRVGRTPSPGPPTITEEEQQPPSATESAEDPATEEKEPPEDVPDEENAAPADEEETNVEDDGNDEVEQPPPQENNDDVNEEPVVADDDDAPAADEPVIEVEAVNGNGEVKEDEIIESVVSPQSEEVVATDEPIVPVVEPESKNLNDEYYPAKPDDNLLQFVANQPNLALRGQLMDHYMTSLDVERLERAFQHLKSFAPDEQNNLLRVDIMPRLRDCR